MALNWKPCPGCGQLKDPERSVCERCQAQPFAPLSPPEANPPAAKPPSATGGEISTGAGVAIFLVAIVFGVVVLGNVSLRDLFGLPPVSSASVRQSEPPSLPSLLQPSASKSERELIYRVSGEGTSSASVTYENAQGGTEQRKVDLPWEVAFKFKSGEFAYLSAQNQEEYGGLTVEILLDGKPWKKSTSDGAYTIASASDSVPSGSF